jgi:dUTP pyrophosphatase
MWKIINGGQLPTRATKYSAYVDLYANDDCVIGVDSTEIVGLGICIDADSLDHSLLSTHYLDLKPRSSLRANGILAGSGVIDLDYNLELKIILHNVSNIRYTIKRGDRIAQITLKEHKSWMMGIESEVLRSGGFGSSGQ